MPNKRMNYFKLLIKIKKDVVNWEITSNPTVNDTPNGAERKTYIY